MAKSKAVAKKKTSSKISHPGMMGDGTEEQNLSERGNPRARIKQADVAAAFGQGAAKKPTKKTAKKAAKKKK
jgi:hypothetical protein